MPKGPILEVQYYEKVERIPFRFKDDDSINRYRIIPYYARNKMENLPAVPVIYLGLSRLIPIGEVPDDTSITDISKYLPDDYIDEFCDLYHKLCNIKISEVYQQENIANIKTRPTFNSNIPGVDSYSISAGQDNIQILLTSLLSLKYFYNNSSKSNKYESILLIDELDATLHPTLQYKLLNILNDFSSQYKIQIFFTTHSLSLIEYSINKKCNILYLIDNFTPETKSGSITLLPEPTLQNISFFLQNKIDDGKHKSKKIPVFTEDNEARLFIKEILNFKIKENDDFSKISGLFQMGQFNIGAKTLLQMHDDEIFFRSLFPSIIILDGDERPSNKDKKTYLEVKKDHEKKHVMFLPGNKSPEKLLFDYSLLVYDSKPDFWESLDVIQAFITKEYYISNIKNEIEKIDQLELKFKEKNESSNGKIRLKRKNLFNKNEMFFKLLLRHWLKNNENKQELDQFIRDLEILFRKVCTPNGINPNIWPN